MNNRRFAYLFAAAALLSVGSLFFATPAQANAVNIMSIESLAQMLDNPDLIILDVRTGRDWKSSTKKIKGALRVDPGNFSGWSTTYAKDKTIVLYCA